MCTVSFIPLAHGYLLTSSRDEYLRRETLPPRTYLHAGKKMIYPKDTRSGGTWIAGCNDETVACLLNGAFEKHEKKSTQTVSRGIMFLDSLQHDKMEEFVGNFDFEQVEPFTLLRMKTNALYELKWNGSDTFLRKLDKGKPNIWSSPTLYTPEQRIEREKWFYQWITSKSNYPDFDMLGFHNSRHGEDQTSDIVMSRSNGMQTVSITQIRNGLFTPSMIHVDLKAGKTYGPLFYTI